MVKEIFTYEVLADTRSKTPKYVVYVVGKWTYHVMDWAGCNFRRIKAPNQPVFKKIADAVTWAKRWMEDYHKHKVFAHGEGSHVAEIDNVIEARLVYESGEYKHQWAVDGIKELSMKQWSELRENVREARKNPERASW